MPFDTKKGRTHARILTVTLNPAIDLFCETDVVRPTHKLRTYGEHMDPGGGGINVARVIRELGGDVRALFLAGGPTGQLLQDLLRQEEIPAIAVPVAGATRINHVVRERQSGEEFRFVLNGPTITAAERAALFDVVAAEPFDYLVASGSLPAGVPVDDQIALGRLCRERGARFVLDCSGEGLRQTLAAGGVYLVKPSIGELETLVGRPLPEAADQDRAALEIVRKGQAEFVAATLGADGALLASAHGVIRLAPPPIEARSAVGAGDSFLAGLVLSLAHGDTEADALAHGIAAGSAAVLEHGTRLCRAEDVDRLYRLLNPTLAA